MARSDHEDRRFDVAATLIDREKRERPQQARALDRRMAAWRQEVERARWAKPTGIKAVHGAADGGETAGSPSTSAATGIA